MDQPPNPGFTPPPASGIPFGSGSFQQFRDTGYRPSEEEVNQAFYAHIFAAVGVLIACGLGLVAPLIIYALAKEKRPFMLFHLNQSFIFQALFFVTNIFLAMAGSFFCFPFVLALPTWLIAWIYPVVIGLAAREGQWKEYIFVGEKVLREWKPLLK